MKRTKKDFDFLCKVADDNLAGAYNPEHLTKSYEMLTGRKEPTTPKVKRQTLMGWYNYQRSIDQTELAVEPPTITGATHSEKVDLVKPKAKRKKRVTKPRKTKSNLNLDA